MRVAGQRSGLANIEPYSSLRFSMNNEPKLDQLITDGTAGRDAVHIAVAPVSCLEDVDPGDHVGLIEGSTSIVSKFAPHIGIVSPFLEETVFPGQKFWLFLYPGTITGLRHVWQHPAFTKASESIKEKLQ